MDQPWIVTCVLMLVGFGAGLAAWPLAESPRRIRIPAYLLLAIIIFMMPFVFVLVLGTGTEVLPWRLGVTLVCPVFAAGLLDLYVGIDDWKHRSFRTYALFVLNPYVLVYRSHVREPRRETSESLKLVARGSVETALGIALLVWAFKTDESRAFWLDHAIKLLAVYLCAFDGQFILITGLLRLGRCHVLDYSREPALAITPADFWRRYNRGAGLLFQEDVFRPANGRRAPTKAIMLSFILNGAYHEYLATVLIGRVTGYQLAFFVIHGLAVAATYRCRPTGWTAAAVLAGRAGTIALLYFTAVLFFTNVDQVHAGWFYGTPSPLP